MIAEDTMEYLDEESLEIDSLLESLSLDLMKDNITHQILGEYPTNTDFLGIVLDKFEVILEGEEIEEADKTEVKLQMIDFCEDLIYLISEQYDIGVNLLSEDYTSHIELLQTLYGFFVSYRYDITETFFRNYITINKSALIASLDKDDTGKDITSLSYKKKNIPKEDVIVLASISEIINFIVSSQAVDMDEFLEVVDEGQEEVHQMQRFINNGTLSGDFVPKLFYYMVGRDYDSFEYTQLRNNIRITFHG